MAQTSSRTLIAIAVATVLTTSCGGSSGPSTNNNDNSGGDSGPTPGALTLTNYKQVVKDGYGGFGSLDESSTLFNEVAVFGAFGSISESAPASGQSIAATCESGSGSLTVTTASAAQLSPGNTIVETYDNCQISSPTIGGSVTLDGQAELEITKLSGDALSDSPTNGEFELVMTFTDFTIDANTSEASGSFRLDGDLSIGLAASATKITATLGTTDGLAMSATDNGQTEQFNLKSMDMTVDTDVNETETVDMNFTYQDMVDGAATDITFETIVPFVIVKDGKYANQGKAKITSSKGGAILLTANGDGETVRLEVDLNGDGVYDEVIEGAVPWSDLDPDAESGS
ncbi:MAG TPA: hypothetical protein ENK26_07820 [Gammaproteobacteria bacterium]|nr:hypothetical protein [Gammaproteobacteria bacterium]